MLYHILSDDVKAVEWIRAETLLIVKRLNSSASSSSSSQWLKRSATLLQHLFVGDRQCQQVALVDDHQLHHRPQTMADKDSHQKLEYFHSFFFLVPSSSSSFSSSFTFPIRVDLYQCYKAVTEQGKSPTKGPPSSTAKKMPTRIH